MTNDARVSPAVLWACLAAGLATFLFGIGMLGWEMRFRGDAKVVTAMKVHDAARQRTVIQIRDGQRVVEFPAHSDDNRRLGSVVVLYNPELNAISYRDESDARLMGGPFFAALGSLFLLVALVGLRNVWSNVQVSDWTDLALVLAGFAALIAVACWVTASWNAEWRWGFSALLAILLMTGLAIAGLAAVRSGSRSLFGYRARLPAGD